MKSIFNILMFFALSMFKELVQSPPISAGHYTLHTGMAEYHLYHKFAPKRRLGLRTEIRKDSIKHYLHMVFFTYWVEGVQS